MQFAGENDAEDGYARWLLEHAQIRAMARRQLALSIPIVVAGALVAIISTFTVGHAVPPPFSQQHTPHKLPISRHVIVFVSTGSTEART